MADVLNANRRLLAENKDLRTQVGRLSLDRAEYVASMATAHMVGRSKEREKVAAWLRGLGLDEVAADVAAGRHDPQIERIDVE